MLNLKLAPWIILGVVLAVGGAYVVGEYRGVNRGAASEKIKCNQTMSEIRQRLAAKNRLVEKVLEEQKRQVEEIVEERVSIAKQEVESEAASQKLVDEYEAKLDEVEAALEQSGGLDENNNCSITDDDARSLRQL